MMAGSYGLAYWYTRGRAGLRACWASFALMLLIGCAPALYSVDMRYVPTGNIRKTEIAPPITVTVATFADLRKIDDKIQIGRVVRSDGREILVLPKFRKPSQVITIAFKDLLQQAGYHISAETTAWDLTEGNMKKEWGPILVGGSIDELEVVCNESLTLKKYQAKAKITLLIADTRSGKILYRVSTDSSASLDHILFSEEKLEQEINTALSDAIQKIWEGKEIATMISKAAAQQP